METTGDTPQRVQTLPLLLMQEGDFSLTSVELSTRRRDGQVVAALSGDACVDEAAGTSPRHDPAWSVVRDQRRTQHTACVRGRYVQEPC
jgi:hypothetical protein